MTKEYAERWLANIRRQREREAAQREITAQPRGFGEVVPKLPTLDYYDRHIGDR